MKLKIVATYTDGDTMYAKHFSEKILETIMKNKKVNKDKYYHEKMMNLANLYTNLTWSPDCIHLAKNYRKRLL